MTGLKKADEKGDTVLSSERMLSLIVLFVVFVCLSGLVLAVDYSGRVELVKSERASCKLVIADRLGTIKVRDIQARGAQAIANDPFQSPKTRGARLAEARALQKSIDDLRTRVDPKNGGKLVCDMAFPNPGVF